MKKFNIKKIQNRWVLYNPEKMPEPAVYLFNCHELEKRQLITGRADGRGETCFYKSGAVIWVLRHYLRGGLIAKILKDHYLGFRLRNSRAWKEWHLLNDMRELDLPVPVPVAASVIKKGFIYQADLISEYIEDTETLADLLEDKVLGEKIWQRIGECIRRFHNHYVFHSDLNARNILIDKEGKIFLIDFDKCMFKKSERWKPDNLSRLHRSLLKFKAKSDRFNFTEEDWSYLLSGYK